MHLIDGWRNECGGASAGTQASSSPHLDEGDHVVFRDESIDCGSAGRAGNSNTDRNDQVFVYGCPLSQTTPENTLYSHGLSLANNRASCIHIKPT
jgi:hypothetical protein